MKNSYKFDYEIRKLHNNDYIFKINNQPESTRRNYKKEFIINNSKWYVDSIDCPQISYNARTLFLRGRRVDNDDRTDEIYETQDVKPIATLLKIIQKDMQKNNI